MFQGKNILLRLLFLGAIVLNQSISEAQYVFTNNPASRIVVQLAGDTSDYIPYFEPNALEMNLMIAASKGNTFEIDRLIAKGADINSATPEGATPLVFAVSGNKTEAVRRLLKYEPELEYRTRNDETPLSIAVKSGYFEITELLIRAGADMSASDRYGASPLHYAAVSGYSDITDLLLYYDAFPDARTSDGTTPVLASAWSGQIATADILLQGGADPGIADESGLSPFLLAAFNGDTLLMDLLIKNGADIYAMNNTGHNALSIAVIRNDTATMRFLLKMAGDWNSQAGKSLDPYNVASAYSRKDAAAILGSSGISGKTIHRIDQAAFTLSSKFNLHDYITGFSLAFKEPLSQFGFHAGLDMKIWDTRVFISKTESVLYQYHNRSYLAYAGLFRDFRISETLIGWDVFFSPSLSVGYSFGHSLKGTLNVPPDEFKINPALAIKFIKGNYFLSAGTEYLKTPYYKNGPVWIRLGFGYNYYFDNVRLQLKPPKWIR
ncbi:MAG: ankyrin repeat domain-containing protein [Bacteroidales bacterium]|nr:ankyrin repeat domain-containing protein [Bacteroidales bacterium]